MKKQFAAALAALLLLCTTACGVSPASETSQTEPARPMGAVGGVQIANPYITCDSLEQAEELSGFPIILPQEQPQWATEMVIRALDPNQMEDRLTEIIYTDGTDEIRIRKAPGTEDIGGVYEDYETHETLTIADHSVTTGGEDGLIYTAAWTETDFSYFIRASKGLTGEELTHWVGSIQ